MLSVSAYPSHKLLNGGTNLYETWYVCYGTWAHLNGVCLKSLPSVSVSVCILIVARQRLSENVTASTNTCATIEELLDASFLYGPCRIKGKYAVLPRTSCFKICNIPEYISPLRLRYPVCLCFRS
jgi:hypothetical protein